LRVALCRNTNNAGRPVLIQRERSPTSHYRSPSRRPIPERLRGSIAHTHQQRYRASAINTFIPRPLAVPGVGIFRRYWLDSGSRDWLGWPVYVNEALLADPALACIAHHVGLPRVPIGHHHDRDNDTDRETSDSRNELHTVGPPGFARGRLQQGRGLANRDTGSPRGISA
jgi:hypothetical protein